MVLGAITNNLVNPSNLDSQPLDLLQTWIYSRTLMDHQIQRLGFKVRRILCQTQGEDSGFLTEWQICNYPYLQGYFGNLPLFECFIIIFSKKKIHNFLKNFFIPCPEDPYTSNT